MLSAIPLQHAAQKHYGHDAVDCRVNFVLKGKDTDLFSALLDEEDTDLFSALLDEDTDLFSALLGEFTGGALTLPDARMMWRRSASTLTSKEGEYKEQEQGDHGCQEYNSQVFAADSSTKLVAVEKELLLEDPQKIYIDPRTRQIKSSTESLVISSLASGKEKAADASCCPKASAVHRVILYGCVRTLTNTTYVRRMHMSREDALGLFPEAKHSLGLVFKPRTKRRASSRNIMIGTSVRIRDHQGRCWPVVLECLRTAGQRHVRLNKGWAEMCVANGLSVGVIIRLARWKNAPSSSSMTRDAHITMSIV